MQLIPRTDRRGPLLVYGLGTAALLGLALPGLVGWWPLLFVALVPLLLAGLVASPGRSALVGFGCGLLHHLVLLYWIFIVLGRYGNLPWWLSLPALLLLAAYMASFTAAFAFLLSLAAGRHQQQSRSTAVLVWAAPVLWVGLDYLRSILLSGFPWMDLGYGLATQPRLIQAADLGGHHLLTFSIVLGNGLLVALLLRLRGESRPHLRPQRWPLVLACLFLVGIAGYSVVRYRVVEPALAGAPQARIAVVQGNIDQALKWSAEAKAATVSKYLRLSRSVLQETDAQLVVWPETALPFYLQRDALMGRIVDFTSASNTWLLTGTPFYTLTPQRGADDQVRFYNGAMLIGPSGKIGGQHAKQHLVPFGEYVPLRRYLPFLEPLVVNIGDFSVGTSTAPLVLGPMKLGVLICYESIFPEISRQAVNSGANLLVNLTNDAWYGRSSAPYQSMAMAIVRAVETRRTLIRSANTGISGFVDPLGRVMGQTAIFTEKAFAARVAMLEERTVFSRYGHWFGASCCLPAALLLVFRRRREP